MQSSSPSRTLERDVPGRRAHPLKQPAAFFSARRALHELLFLFARDDAIRLLGAG
jgi:hypothetical protein